MLYKFSLVIISDIAAFNPFELTEVIYRYAPFDAGAVNAF